MSLLDRRSVRVQGLDDDCVRSPSCRGDAHLEPLLSPAVPQPHCAPQHLAEDTWLETDTASPVKRAAARVHKESQRRSAGFRISLALLDHNS